MEDISVSTEGSPDVEADRLYDRAYFVKALTDLDAKVESGGVDGLEAKRKVEFYETLCKATTGHSLDKLQTGGVSIGEILDKKQAFLDLGIKEIRQVKAAMNRADGLDVKKKSRWVKALDDLEALQRRARSRPWHFMIYVGRDGEENKVFKLTAMHMKFFAAWNAQGAKNVVLMAHPRSGKTTCGRYQNLWDIAEKPHLKFLLLFDTEQKARKEVAVMKHTMRSGRCHALYPEIEIIRGIETEAGVSRVEDSTERFTVTRPNWGEREPTVEAGAIGSSLQGNGYDRIRADDVCKPEVIDQPILREQIIQTWDQVIEQRLSDPRTARIQVTCTPWHNEDLAGHIQSQVRKGLRSEWVIHTTPVLDDDAGNPISPWPDRFSSDFYAGKRRTMTPSAYARLFKMQCMADEDRIVGKLCYYPAEGDLDRIPQTIREAFEKQLAKVFSGEQCLSVDPSATSGASSTETAVTQIAMTADGQPYIVDCWFFAGNPVRVQEFLVACITKEQPEDQEAFRLPKTDINVILFEFQGGMTGTVILWEEYIRRRLKEKGCSRSVRLERTDTRTATYAKQKQNQSKERRLRNSSPYMENGIVKFPGRVIYRDGKVSVVHSQRENIAKLCNQIINFPAGLDDGVDTVTQYILRYEYRMASDKPPPDAGMATETYNPMRAGKLQVLDRLRRKDSSDDEFALEEQELQWCLN